MAPSRKQMLQAIADWKAVTVALAVAKKEELRLRLYIVAQSFPTLKEGTNTCEAAGLVLKATGKVNRDIDVAALSTLESELRKLKLPLDTLIDYKPSLKLGAYRTLDETARKYFDRVLTIKDSTPTLQIEAKLPPV